MNSTLTAVLGVVFLVSEIGLAIFKRSRGAGNKDRSLWLLWSVIALSIFCAIQVAETRPTPNFLYALVLLGAILFALGIVLRWWAIIQLGRFFTVDVAIAQDHHVVDSGPYRFVRHPSYSGALVAFIGFGLTMQSWPALLVLLVPIACAFAYRINVEERALADALGESYRAYCRRTKRLVPGVY